MPLALGLGLSPVLASPSGISLSSLFAKYGGGMDFTDLDITKTWGPAGLKRYYSDNGVTPISGNGQGVQLALSGDRGLALGPELWNHANVTVAGGSEILGPQSYRIYSAAGANSYVTEAGVLTVGKQYLVTFTIDSIAVLGAGVRVFESGPIFTTTGPKQCIWLADVTNAGIKRTNTACDFQISNVSYREVLGNHAYQSTSGSRPQWQTGNKLVLDGVDDYEATGLIPTSTFTLIAKVDVPATISATQIIAGANDAASANRCFLALDTSGRVCGGVGSQSVTTILGSNDLRSTTKVLALTLDGSTVKLYENGETVYSAAQSGSPTTTNAIYIGANNNNNSAASFFGGAIKAAAAFKGCLTPSEIAYLTNLMGTL